MSFIESIALRQTFILSFGSVTLSTFRSHSYKSITLNNSSVNSNLFCFLKYKIEPFPFLLPTKKEFQWKRRALVCALVAIQLQLQLPSTSFRDLLKYINHRNPRPFLQVYRRNFNEIYIIILNANLDVLSDMSFNL